MARPNSYARWTKEEDEYLRNVYPGNDTQLVLRRLSRHSLSAVHARALRLGVQKRDIDGWTLREVAEAFGAPEHTVRYWAERGYLKTRHRGLWYFVTQKQLAAFGRSAWGRKHIYWPMVPDKEFVAEYFGITCEALESSVNEG